MLDLKSFAVIDHHCHPFETEMATLDPESLARVFFHGSGDIPTPGVEKRRLWGATDELRYHFSHIGVVQTMVCQLSKLFGCPAELEAVASERNRRTSESFATYAKLLYEDAGIVGTVLDTSLPKDDPLLDLIPGRVIRLFQMDPALDKLLEHSGSYQELLNGYREILVLAITEEGFVGVKSHVAERVGFGLEPVSDAEAEVLFPAAKAGDSEAYKRLYAAIFTTTLLQCQELGVPVHLHSGVTGGLTWEGPVSNADPFLLAPFIRKPEFLRTKIVLLHAGYPWVQHAATLAHVFPHVWVDMGWTTPWVSLCLSECIREVIGIAPLSKVTIGSGAHGTPEIAWLAARTTKIALAEVLGNAVKLRLMAPKQGERVARMILHDNAARMYGVE